MDTGKKASSISILWNWSKRHHNSFIGSIALAAIGVGCGIVPYFCLSNILNLLLDGNGTGYWSWCLVAVCGYIGKALFSSLSTMLSHRATYHTLKDLRENLLAKLSRVPMGTILDTPSGQYKTTIVDRVEGMEHTLAHLLPEMTSNLLIPFAIAVYIFTLDWRMGIASLVTTVIGLFIVSRSGKVYAAHWKGAVEVGRRMANAIVEYIGGIQVVKAFSQSAGSYKKYSEAVKDNANYYVSWMKNSQKYMCLWQAIIPSVLIVVLPVGLWLWSCNSLSSGDFLTVIALSLGLTGPLISAMSFVDDLAVLDETVDEIAEILNADELIRPKTRTTISSAEIRLQNVCFSYGKDEILHNLDLEIKPGTVTALVGPSGSGKSTIAKLIVGFWDVTGGSILLGGTDIRMIPHKQLNQQIAYVSQDNYLFNRTIRENIRLGNLAATDADVEAVAIASGCHDFIQKLDAGYETVCGSAGDRLSGGEKQRISIARAMLKNAPIILLDEATASIDPENEAIIQNALSKLTKGKTLVVIAHRLSTIVDAEKIVVIDKGHIVAQGTQNELLNTCPLYAKMWQAHLGVQDA